MKKLLLLLALTFLSAQSFAGSCPDGSDPVKSISDDGTYFVYKCGGSAPSSSNNSSESTTITKTNNSSNNTNSIKIPFNKGSNYSYKVNQNRVLLTDLDKYDYSNCKYTVEKNLFRNPLDSSSFLKKHSYLAIPDLETLGVGEQDIDEVTNTFAENLYKLHHACLSKDQNACKAIHKVVDLFSGNLALTKNNDNSNYHKHDELSWYHHEIVYHSINNILMPLMLSYSTANQALGAPKNHNAIGDWFKQTFYRNLYNPKPLANEMPIQRCMLRNTDYVAANHTLAASSLVMLYGVTWDDQHAFNLGIEGFYSTLNSVRSDGSMSFEARRGANAMFYSGGTLSQLLKIYQVALNQGIVLDKVHSLHRAAKFLLDVVEDQTIIYKYAKGNAMAWCSENYKEQCFTETGPRTASFGWVKHYMRLFPEHQNTKRIEAFANELATSDVITEKRKRSLNSVIKGHFPTELFRKNVVFDRYDKEYQNEYVFEDSLNWNSGSPMCLYDTVNISETTKTSFKVKPNEFEASLASVGEFDLKKLGENTNPNLYAFSVHGETFDINQDGHDDLIIPIASMNSKHRNVPNEFSKPALLFWDDSLKKYVVDKEVQKALPLLYWPRRIRSSINPKTGFTEIFVADMGLDLAGYDFSKGIENLPPNCGAQNHLITYDPSSGQVDEIPLPKLWDVSHGLAAADLNGDQVTDYVVLNSPYIKYQQNVNIKA